LLIFEIATPDPWCSVFSIASYNQLTGILRELHLKRARGSGGADIRLANAMCVIAQISSNEIQDNKLKFYMVSFESFDLPIQESYDAKRLEHDS
jgi:hypothetical protein